jgi:uridine kinase
MSIEAIIADAKAFEPSEGQPNFAVAVCGGSGTGKSYISAELCAAIQNDVKILQQDDYQLGRNFPELNTSPYRYDDPKNFQIKRFARDLRTLRQGNSIPVPNFNLATVQSETEKDFVPTPVLIVDGLYAALNGLRNCIDRSVYVEAPLYARFLRRLFRLTHQYEIADPAAAVKHTFGPTLRAHRDFVRTQRDTADVIKTPAYSFEQTIAHFALEPISGESAQQTIWSKDKLSFMLSEHSNQARFCVTWDDQLYSQFSITPESVALIRQVTDFEEP